MTNVSELAKEVEIWAAKLRYDSNLNDDIPLELLCHMNTLSKSKNTDVLFLIKSWIEVINSLGHKTPENIKNRILSIEAFK
jgi:hypothetical protein